MDEASSPFETSGTSSDDDDDDTLDFFKGLAED
jgi:hypothetical protein